MPYDTSNSFAINFIIRRNGGMVSVTSPSLPTLKYFAHSTEEAAQRADEEIGKALDQLIVHWQPLPVIEAPKARYRRWTPNTPLALKLFLYQRVQQMTPAERKAWINDSTSAIRRVVGPVVKRGLLMAHTPYHSDLVIEQLEKLGHPVVALTTTL